MFALSFLTCAINCGAQGMPEEIQLQIESKVRPYLGNGLSVCYIPSTGDVFVAEELRILEEQAITFVELGGSLNLGKVAKPNNGNANRPTPGWYSVKGVLTNVSQSGSTYMLTCVPSAITCFSYFIPY